MIVKSKTTKGDNKYNKVLKTESADGPIESAMELKSETENQEVDTGTTTDNTKEMASLGKKSSKGLILSLLATLLVGGALTGGILYSRTSLDTRSKAAQDPSSDSGPVGGSSDVGSVTATITPEVTPTIEELDLTEYSISILNGSGVAGQAGAVRDLLEEAGFEDMDTDNADSYDYEETEVSLTEGTPKSVFDVIHKALEGDYEVKKSDTIKEDSSYDILIIVGQN